MKKENVGKILMASVGLLFGIIALILAFFPFKIFFKLPAAFLPGFIGFFLGVFAINISNKNNLKKKLPATTLMVNFIAIFIGITSLFFKSDKIAKDNILETKTEQVKQEVEQSTDLQDALQDLDQDDLNDALGDSTSGK